MIDSKTPYLQPVVKPEVSNPANEDGDQVVTTDGDQVASETEELQARKQPGQVGVLNSKIFCEVISMRLFRAN